MNIFGFIVIAVITFIILRTWYHRSHYKTYIKTAYKHEEESSYSSTPIQVCICDYNQLLVIFNNNQDMIKLVNYRNVDFHSETFDYLMLNQIEKRRKVLLVPDKYPNYIKVIKLYNNYIQKQKDAKNNALLAGILSDSLEQAQYRKTKAEEELEQAIQRTQEIVNRIHKENDEKLSTQTATIPVVTNSYLN